MNYNTKYATIVDDEMKSLNFKDVLALIYAIRREEGETGVEVFVQEVLANCMDDLTCFECGEKLYDFVDAEIKFGVWVEEHHPGHSYVVAAWTCPDCTASESNELRELRLEKAERVQRMKDRTAMPDNIRRKRAVQSAIRHRARRNLV